VERLALGGRYELGPALGSGGFGTVFRARDRRSGFEVAVKLVRHGLGSELAAQRLRREGAILRRVSSRHVARVYDSGADDHGVWLVTELVDGAPLAIATLGRPLLPHEVLRVARGLLEGLAAVHGAGIIHGDVKPSNVLVPRGDKALDNPKLVDFGLARMQTRAEVAASVGAAMTREGMVLGTARWMAPEVLSGGEPTARSDLYAAGLMLFELLDVGPLFSGSDTRAQLRARVSNELQIRERVPEPLSDVLERLLARDPAARYVDARAAHEAVADLDTAPVSVVRIETIPPASRLSALPPRPRAVAEPPPTSVEAPPSTKSTLPPPPSAPHASNPPPAPASVGSPRSRPTTTPMSSSPPPSRAVPPPEAPRSPRSPSSRPASDSRRRTTGFSVGRLTSLPGDAIAALRETLRHLDLSMLDALARRERGNATGRIARAVALALRLELDAAALILEPLAMQSGVARAIGATALSPRARRVTRARVDSDREDRWIDSIDPELGGMLAALAASIATADDAPRDAVRCARALARLEAAASSPSVEATRTTLRVAHAAARVRRGEIDRGTALDLLAPYVQVEDWSADSAFHLVVRALSSSAFYDPLRASAELERAERIAAETGTTLLDACAATALGTLLAALSPRDQRALLALERAGTLLAHGDAPSLEHEAEQRRAEVLVALGRWHDAVMPLRAAREAAHSERAGELELASAALEAIVQLAIGEAKAAYEAAAILGDARLSNAKGPTAAWAWIARALTSLAASDREGAEDALTEAEARLHDADRRSADAHVVVGIVGLLFEAARAALPDLDGAASTLERVAGEHGFEGFHWLDVLGAIVERLPDAEGVRRMKAALAQLRPVLGPESRLARECRLDAPPPDAALEG
jgi:serine/threonine-protein kinase